MGHKKQKHCLPSIYRSRKSFLPETSVAETAVAAHSFAVLGSHEILLLLLTVLYLSEILEAMHKFVCDLGFFYPVIYENKLLERFNIRGNGGLLITIGIFTLLFHFGICAMVFSKLYG